MHPHTYAVPGGRYCASLFKKKNSEEKHTVGDLKYHLERIWQIWTMMIWRYELQHYIQRGLIKETVSTAFRLTPEKGTTSPKSTESTLSSGNHSSQYSFILIFSISGDDRLLEVCVTFSLEALMWCRDDVLWKREYRCWYKDYTVKLWFYCLDCFCQDHLLSAF